MSTLNLKEIKNPNAPIGIQLLNDGGVVLPGSLTSTITGGGGSISGDRNRVINGSCQIVNVATVAVPNNTTGYGGPEMFPAINGGAGGQFTQSQGTLTFQGLSLPTVRQTVNTAPTSIAAGNGWSGILHRFEGFNVFDLRGKPLTVSFVFNANVSGTYSVSVRDSNSSQSYVTTITAVANTPIQVSIPLTAVPTAANIPNTNDTGLVLNVGYLNTGNNQTSTLNTWQSGNFASATGATNWGATAGNFIELTRLQLEEGTVATPFVWRSYGQELALTQRYFEWLAQSSGEEDSIAYATQTNAITFSIPMKVSKRGPVSFTGNARISPNGIAVPVQLATSTVLNQPTDADTTLIHLTATKATANLTVGSVYQVDFSVAGGAVRPFVSARL